MDNKNMPFIKTSKHEYVDPPKIHNNNNMHMIVSKILVQYVRVLKLLYFSIICKVVFSFI